MRKIFSHKEKIIIIFQELEVKDRVIIIDYFENCYSLIKINIFLVSFFRKTLIHVIRSFFNTYYPRKNKYLQDKSLKPQWKSYVEIFKFKENIAFACISDTFVFSGVWIT